MRCPTHPGGLVQPAITTSLRQARPVPALTNESSTPRQPPVSPAQAAEQGQTLVENKSCQACGLTCRCCRRLPSRQAEEASRVPS
jgi:hypothetical protein